MKCYFRILKNKKITLISGKNIRVMANNSAPVKCAYLVWAEWVHLSFRNYKELKTSQEKDRDSCLML